MITALGPSDAAASAALIARAFQGGDPVTAHLVPAEERRHRLLPHLLASCQG